MRTEFDNCKWQDWLAILLYTGICVCAGIGLLYMLTTYILPKSVIVEMKNERLQEENNFQMSVIKDYEKIIDELGKKGKRR